MALENRLNAINDYLQYTEDQTEIRIESIKMELEEVSKRVLQNQLKHYQKAFNLKKLEKNGKKCTVKKIKIVFFYFLTLRMLY